MSKKLNKTVAVDYSILPEEIIEDVKVFENYLDFIGLSADGHPCVTFSNGNSELLLSFDLSSRRYNYYYNMIEDVNVNDIPFDSERIKELLNMLKDNH